MSFWARGTLEKDSSTPEVAAGHHGPVRLLENVVQVGVADRRLDLGDHRRLLAGELAHPTDVFARRHEGGSHQVDLLLAPEGEVDLVLVRDGRHVDVGAGKGDALVVAQHAADDDLGFHEARRRVDGFE